MRTAEDCIDHMANCPINKSDDLKKLLALAEYPRVYVKISHLRSLSKEKYPYKDTHDPVKRLYDKFGPKRLLGEPIGRWARRTAATPRRWRCTATSCHTSPRRIGA